MCSVVFGDESDPVCAFAGDCAVAALLKWKVISPSLYQEFVFQ